MFFPIKVSSFFSGAVVGTVHSAASLAAALKLRNKTVDFLELRLDAFAAPADLERLEKSIPKLAAPLIITARHPLEGGAGRLTPGQRRALHKRFLPYASLIDVELRSAAALADVIAQAQAEGVGVILSHHDFRRTPPADQLRKLCRKAQTAGCCIFKVATMAHEARDLATLLDFLATPRRGAPLLSVMGMGPFGKISRLALAKAGSVLNYGYLDKPQVAGQWPAVLLKERLAELSQ